MTSAEEFKNILDEALSPLLEKINILTKEVKGLKDDNSLLLELSHAIMQSVKDLNGNVPPVVLEPKVKPPLVEVPNKKRTKTEIKNFFIAKYEEDATLFNTIFTEEHSTKIFEDNKEKIESKKKPEAKKKEKYTLLFNSLTKEQHKQVGDLIEE